MNWLSQLTDAKFVTFRALIDSQAEKVALALAASDKAVNKAELATEKRFEAVNEFRGQLNDQAARLLERREAEARFAAMGIQIDSTAYRGNERLAAVESRLDRIEATAAGARDKTSGIQANIGLYLAVATVIITITVFLANYLTSN